MSRGVFITFEGGEGAGKSTQVRALSERLRGAGKTVTQTREPGGSPFADSIRDLLLAPAPQPRTPLAEAFLFQGARADHLALTIRPALAAGHFVVCDRFSDSTRAYQGVAGGVPAEQVRLLEQIAVGADRPDLTILIDLEPGIGLARATARRAPSAVHDAFEGRSLDFHRRLREGFLEIAKSEPHRCVVVDGARARDELAERIWQVVAQRFLAER
jgi:dTMP kinase